VATSPPEESLPAGETTNVPFGLQLDRELFSGELQVLQVELGALHAELESIEAPAFRDALQDIEHRMENLSLRSERVNRLLDRLLEAEESPDVGGTPLADVPVESP